MDSTEKLSNTSRHLSEPAFHDVVLHVHFLRCLTITPPPLFENTFLPARRFSFSWERRPSTGSGRDISAGSRILPLTHREWDAVESVPTSMWRYHRRDAFHC